MYCSVVSVGPSNIICYASIGFELQYRIETTKKSRTHVIIEPTQRGA